MSKLIVVSGLDGCGKSTMCKMIDGYLTERNIPVTRSSAISEYSTKIGRKIGDLLRAPADSTCELPPDAEHALMIAARSLAEHNVIKPALDDGQWVVSDRYGLCGMVYQRGPNGRFIDGGVYQMRLATFGLTRKPDLEIILDIDPAKPHKPHEPHVNRLEDRPLDEWKLMRDLYVRLSQTEPYATLIDGHIPAADAFDRVKPYIDKLIEEDNHEEH